jgi:hypothetical protein
MVDVVTMPLHQATPPPVAADNVEACPYGCPDAPTYNKVVFNIFMDF